MKKDIEFYHRVIFGTLIIVVTIILLFNLHCSFDYDNDYLNKPPDSIIGTSCDNEGDTVKYEYGDYYYCAMCLKSADGLAWFEIQCEEEEK